MRALEACREVFAEPPVRTAHPLYRRGVGRCALGERLFARLDTVPRDMSRRLSDDSSQLSLDLSRAALPAAVNARARQLGYAPAELSDTVLVEVAPEELTQQHLEVQK